VNWLWAHRDAFTSDATNPNWDTKYSTVNDHEVTAEASIRWLTSFVRGDTYIYPILGVGVRQLLTNDDDTVRQSVNGADPFVVESERDRTSLTVTGALTLARKNQVLSVAYDGEFSSDYDRHNVWLRYGWQF